MEGINLNSHKEMFKSLKDLELENKITIINSKKYEYENNSLPKTKYVLIVGDANISNIIKKNSREKKLKYLDKIDIMDIDYNSKNNVTISGMTIECMKEKKHYMFFFTRNFYVTKYFYTKTSFVTS